MCHFADHCLCYGVNFIAALAGLACSTCPSRWSNVVGALVAAVLAIPLSFRLWYFTLYSGFKYVFPGPTRSGWLGWGLARWEG